MRAATTSPNLAVDQGLPKSFTLKWSNSHTGPFVSLPSHLDNGNDNDDSNVHMHIPCMNNGTAYHTNKGMRATWPTATSMVQQQWQHRLMEHDHHADRKCNIWQRGAGKKDWDWDWGAGNTFVHILYMGGEVAQWVAHRWQPIQSNIRT